ncbi:MAG: hypothetical protein RAP70_03700 [Candidatus Celaenobacter antarcticus]|nr:hypothetical protein [Candidatus Celaenobacter antarcticus]
MFDSLGWLEFLPSYLIQNLIKNENKVLELVKLRSHAFFHILPLSNDMFAEIILSSNWAIRRTQENIYIMAKKTMLDKSEKELLEVVFRTRVFPQNPVGLKMTEEEIDKALRNINSLSDLKEYFVQRDKEEPRLHHDTFGIGKKIINKVDRILER